MMGLSVDEIVERFCNRLGRRGVIVGPHGSGKSTLLEHAAPRLGQVALRQYSDGRVLRGAADGELLWLSLRRSSQTLRLHKDLWETGMLIVIDGFEQLSFATRWKVIWQTRSKQMGLLATSHRDCGLPVLVRTKADFSLFSELVRELIERAGGGFRPSSVRMKQIFLESRGNMREAFMRLYDEFQRTQRENRLEGPERGRHEACS